MSLFGDLTGKVLPIVGLASAAAQKRKIDKQVQAKLNQQAGPLEIPAAYQQLIAGLTAQADRLGGNQKTQINNDFQQSLAKALAALKQRGLASSNLTANLSAGSQKRQSEALAGVDENVLAQKIGLQQGIGLQGLGQSAAERNQLTGIQGSIYGNLSQSLLQNPFMDLIKSLAGAAGSAAKVAAV